MWFFKKLSTQAFLHLFYEPMLVINPQTVQQQKIYTFGG